VLLDNIVRLESLGSYTRFHISGQPQVVISRILKEYEELLEGHGFIRVHQSSIVNMKHVKKYVRGEGGILWMSDGSEIEVSRRKKEDVVEALKSMAL
jgi:two-component system LytT family response regulator